jgi:hypothetical protein
MIKKFRVWLARKILGAHCPCYQMGHHTMVDYQQRSADKLASFNKRKGTD